MSDTTELNQPSVAITGAGSGLGRALAIKLAAKGYRVFGTARSAQHVADLLDLSSGSVALTLADITDQSAVTAWVDKVSEEVGERGLDVLISNAGTLTPGPLEVIPLDDIRREFEVNVFGALAVINGFLPALRKSRGRIVQIGAMTGRLPVPFDGPSSASKAAFEALADVYRAELKPFGVAFVMAQAGNMRTGGPAKTAAALKRLADSMTAEQRALYGDVFGKFSDALNGMQNAGLSAEASADRVIELVEQVPPPIRAAVGDDAEQILRLVREKSDTELDALRLQLIGAGDA
ncbi:MAG: Short-chain dehydrogenase [Mycobacterium sp.]|nr:Short-chain dehydrogenase [Mycobacterium sp.]